MFKKKFLLFLWLIIGFYSQVSQAIIPASERTVLINLFTDTNGSSWTNTTGWINIGTGGGMGSVGTECSWFGITCDASENNVIGLNLNNNQLAGTLPDLSNLTQLGEIRLRNNQLMGNIAFLNSFTMLIHADFDSNQLSGNLPDLTNLSGLDVLDLSDNQFNGSIPTLNSLESIFFLDFSRNQLTGIIPSNLGGLVTLNKLALDNNQLTGTIPSLSNLTALTFLDLGDNQFIGTIPDLTNLNLLQILRLNNNKLTGTVGSDIQIASSTEILLHRNGCLVPLDTNIENFVLTKIPAGSPNPWISQDCSAPIATDDSPAAILPATIMIDVVANDIDGGLVNPSAVDLDPSTPSIIDNNVTIAGEGTWTVNSSGMVTFTPIAGFNHDPMPLAYKVGGQQITVIDDFNTGSQSVNVPNAGTASDTINATVFGGMRTIDVVGDGVLNTSVEIIAPPGVMAFSTESLTTGMATLSYSSVGGVDLLGGGINNFFSLEILSLDQGGIVLDLTVNGVTVGLGADLIANFTEFSSVDFTNVTTIALKITFTIFASDFNLDSFNVTGQNILTSNQATITIDYLPIATDDVSSGNTLGVSGVVNITQNDITGDIPNVGMVDLDLTTIGIQTSLSVSGQGSWNVSTTSPPNSDALVTFTPMAGFSNNPTPISYKIADGQGNFSNAATITVTYNLPVIVPNVVGQAQAVATSTLTGVNLIVTTTNTSSNTVAVGNVISQAPAAGSNVLTGSTVNIVISTGPAMVNVPNVVGQTQAIATTSLQSAGFVVTNTNAASATVPIGNVISQNPISGTSVVAGSTVNLLISTGISVPNVVGQTQAIATSTLTSANLTVNTSSAANATVPIGNVISQNPVAATNVAAGSVVNLIISTGISVPNVVGQTQAAATTNINSAGLMVSTTNASSNTVLVGNVISQSPTATTNVAAGSTVNLVISTGPAPVNVPDVIGNTQAVATTSLQSAGFVVTTSNAASMSVALGSVISQNPIAGSSAAVGSTVNIVISTGPAPVSVPDVVGQTQAVATSTMTTLGFSVITGSASSSTVAVGSVISQDPSSGVVVAAGSTVTLVISTGPALVSVPDVVGLTQATATSTLSSASLTVNTSNASSATVAIGNVISQIPAVETNVVAGSVVNLVISTGPVLEADIAVDKVLNTTGPFIVGQTIDYTIMVSNQGPNTATNIVITESTTNLIINSFSSTHCTLVFPCIIPTLISGGSEVITMQATISSIGVFDNLVSVSANETDLDTSNNIDNTGNGGTAVVISPIAVNDTVNGILGQSIGISVLVNDTAPASSAFLVASSLALVGASSSNPHQLVNSDGTWLWNANTAILTFLPISTTSISNDSISVQYTIKDSNNVISNSATVTINYPVPVTPPPVVTVIAPIAENDSGNANAGEIVMIVVTDNDQDPDGSINQNSIAIGNNPIGQALVVAGEGTWSISNATITFTPESGFTTNPAPITYTVRDNANNVSNAATITVIYAAVVEPEPEPPVDPVVNQQDDAMSKGIAFIDANNQLFIPAVETRQGFFVAELEQIDNPSQPDAPYWRLKTGVFLGTTTRLSQTALSRSDFTLRFTPLRRLNSDGSIASEKDTTLEFYFNDQVQGSVYWKEITTEARAFDPIMNEKQAACTTNSPDMAWIDMEQRLHIPAISLPAGYYAADFEKVNNPQDFAHPFWRLIKATPLAENTVANCNIFNLANFNLGLTGLRQMNKDGSIIYLFNQQLNFIFFDQEKNQFYWQ